MSLKSKIEAAITVAMKNKESGKLRGLREIKSQLLLAETSGQGEVDEAKELSILQKMAKQRQDSLKIYEEQDRQDLAAKEREELELLKTYLPKPLSADELEIIIKEIIAQTGAESMRDMGKVMPLAKEKIGGGADGRTLSEIIRKLLS
ncbi:GatB/YqeY domain-containing protein [Bacteroidia bacterium]|nr:GatB/YqeY domain-containing protein [Bacteroidia bacterium]